MSEIETFTDEHYDEETGITEVYTYEIKYDDDGRAYANLSNKSFYKGDIEL